MRTIATVEEMQDLARSWRCQGVEVGLVPTMGCLHRGHLALVRCARSRADVVVVSIFVNPTQFGPNEDYERYPRDPERDAALCRDESVDVVFSPAAEEFYSPDHSVWVTEEQLSAGLCGRSRPGHFRGVCTVVAKLFNVVVPDFAVFGQKDGQQALIIRRMVRDLNLPVEVLISPTQREPDGLALSSRNQYLTADERRRATAIHAGLERAQEAFGAGERRAGALCELIAATLEAAHCDRIDYIECVSRADLAAVDTVEGPAMLAVAACFGRTRLIDNCLLDPAT